MILRGSHPSDIHPGFKLLNIQCSCCNCVSKQKLSDKKSQKKFTFYIVFIVLKILKNKKNIIIFLKFYKIQELSRNRSAFTSSQKLSYFLRKADLKLKSKIAYYTRIQITFSGNIQNEFEPTPLKFIFSKYSNYSKNKILILKNVKNERKHRAYNI